MELENKSTKKRTRKEHLGDCICAVCSKVRLKTEIIDLTNLRNELVTSIDELRKDQLNIASKINLTATGDLKLNNEVDSVIKLAFDKFISNLPGDIAFIRFNQPVLELIKRDFQYFKRKFGLEDARLVGERIVNDALFLFLNKNNQE